MNPVADNFELETSALLESVLFVSSGPIGLNRLAAALDISRDDVHDLLVSLEEDYVRRGIRLQWHENTVQLTTAPEAAQTIERFLGLEVTTRLSQAALEVLAIVAYMQPTTRPQIDELRGVNSDGALRTLLSRGMIAEIGRKETPGRPILYGTTPEFLGAFGLGSVHQLPPLPHHDEEETEP